MIYHDKQPIFDDLFVFDIPQDFKPNLSIYLKFYHAKLGKNPEKTDVDRLYLGSSEIPVFINGKLSPKTGKVTFGISLDGQSVEEQHNFVNIELSIKSSLIASEAPLHDFISGCVIN